MVPKRTGKTISWTKIKKEYISSDASIRALAKKYGISASQIANHSREEGWVEKKKQYQNTIVTKSLARQEEKDIDHLLQIKSAADKMADSISKMMEDKNQFRRHISKDKGLIVEEKVLKKFDTQAIRDVTAALKDLSITIKNMYDDGKEDEEDEDETGVILIAPKKEDENKREVVLEDGGLDG